MKDMDDSKHYYNDILRTFEESNNTTTSIYQLDSYDVLIILEDGRNLTDYDSVKNDEEVIFISENLNNCTNLVRKYNFPNVKAIVTQNFNNEVTDTSYMFYSCYNLSSIIGLENWDVSNVCDMHGMFKNCNLFNNLNALKNWNVSNVTNMESMFHDCSTISNLDALKDWNVSKVMDMSYMFENCNNISSLKALSNWNISNLTDMEAMFRDCTGIVNLYGLDLWNTQYVENMSRLFENCMKLNNIDAIQYWNTVNVSNIKKIFHECPCITEKYDVKSLNVKDSMIFSNISNDEYLENDIKGCMDDVNQTTILTDNIDETFLDFYYSSDLEEVMKVLEEIMKSDESC